MDEKEVVRVSLVNTFKGLNAYLGTICSLHVPKLRESSAEI